MIKVTIMRGEIPLEQWFTTPEKAKAWIDEWEAPSGPSS